MLSLQVARHIHHHTQDHGGVVVLDTTAGRWLALNQTAGEFWRSWGGGAGFEEGVAQVAAMYPDVPHASVRADAEQLLSELFSLGLIEAIPQVATAATAAEMAEPQETAGPGPGWLRTGAAAIFLVAAAILVMCSFRLSFVVVRRSHRKWCSQAASLRQASVTVAAVSRAARHYPGRAACLEQSLAAVLLAAATRRRLDWCLGWATDPYRFHAWVEVAGQPILSVGEQGSQRFGYERIMMA
jgi:Transglutaminase-like superfamily/Coenzyme PQQ synthesis protein D (PqqD)